MFREIFNFVFREIFLEFCKIKIYFRFAKLKENFAKHEIKNFVKISRNYKNEVLQQSYAGLTLDGWFFYIHYTVRKSISRELRKTYCMFYILRKRTCNKQVDSHAIDFRFAVVVYSFFLVCMLVKTFVVMLL